MTLSFGDYEISLDRRELRRARRPVHVQPQVFDLLVYLVQNRDRVVSKDDLIASVWSGRLVSDSTLASRINAARKAVGDSGGSQKLIRTIQRKGLRFVGVVDERQDSIQPVAMPPEQASGQPRPALLLPKSARDRRASLQQYERRSGTGVFFRRDQRGHHHGAVQAALVLRDLAQLFFHLQGQVGPYEAGRR
jgi:DNA-binding winged helix-turn-helix (wHTH) protein